MHSLTSRRQSPALLPRRAPSPYRRLSRFARRVSHRSRALSEADKRLQVARHDRFQGSREIAVVWEVSHKVPALSNADNARASLEISGSEECRLNALPIAIRRKLRIGWPPQHRQCSCRDDPAPRAAVCATPSADLETDRNTRPLVHTVRLTAPVSRFVTETICGSGVLELDRAGRLNQQRQADGRRLAASAVGERLSVQHVRLAVEVKTLFVAHPELGHHPARSHVVLTCVSNDAP